MDEAIQQIPVTYLRESPFNPRKSFSETALAELADSIKTQGVMQPIVARTLPAGQQDIWARHEIVFGHRRFRAAKLAGLEAVPVILRPMTDEQAAIAQVHENVQRQDVTALEEADSFTRLQRDHGLSADAIAAAVGKSRSYVYGRIKLAKVATEVRDAVGDKALPADLAIELARLTDHALQRKALKDLRDYNGEWVSVRDGTRRLRQMFSLTISEAKFDPEDTSLAKLAGGCSACPKRAGNDPDLQGVLAADVCTDRLCFEGKTREHIRIELVAMASLGHPVISGPKAAELVPNKHSRPEGYTSPQGHGWLNGQRVSYQAMIDALAKCGEPVPMATIIAIDGGLDTRQFITDEQALAVETAYAGLVGGDNGTDTQSTAGASAGKGAAGGGQDNMADWTPAERVVRDGGAWVLVKRATRAAVLRTPRTTNDMRSILLREFDMADDFGLMAEVMGLDVEVAAAEQAWEDDEAQAEPFSMHAWWAERLGTMTADQLAALMLGVALEDLMGHGNRGIGREAAARGVALAERYGVDVAAAARQDQMDDAGVAGSQPAAGAQVDAFEAA
jgi:ParB/RepB/Spo0J family partition protein